MTSETQARHTFNTQRALVVWSFVIPGVMAIGSSALCGYLLLAGKPVPSELGLAATAASSYVFGDLRSFVRDYLKGGEA